MKAPILSIRSFLLLLLVGELVVVAGLSWGLWYGNGREAVSELQLRLVDQLTERIDAQLQRFVTIPHTVNQINHRAQSMGWLSLEQPALLEAHFWQQLHDFDEVTYVLIGTADEQFVGLERLGDTIRLQLKDESTQNNRYTWDLGESRQRYSRAERPNYSVTQRPWYRAGQRAGGPAWSPIYTFFGTPSRMGITAVRPLYADDGALIGVLGADLNLNAIDAFLQRLEVGQTGRAYIIERDGLLVGNSSGQPSFDARQDPAHRWSVHDFPDPLIQGAAEAIRAEVGDFTGVQRLHLQLEVAGEPVLVRSLPIRDAHGLDWLAFVVVPEVDLVGNITQRTRSTALVFGLMVLGLGIISQRITRHISAPVVTLSRQVRNIRDFKLDNDFSTDSNLSEVRILSEELTSMQAGLASFSHFVPSRLVRQLVAEGEVARLGGEELELTILFSDLVSYSTIIEHLPPAQVVTMLNEYLGEMQTIIEAHHGTVLEYIGDGILVVFGAPAHLTNHPVHATRCALAMQHALLGLNQRWQDRGEAHLWQSQGVPALRARVGIHTGTVVAGNFGSDRYMKYGVVGDSVNVAARLEALNKVLDTEILLSEQVHVALPAELQSRVVSQGEHILKGRQQTLQVYSITGTSSVSMQSPSTVKS